MLRKACLTQLFLLILLVDATRYWFRWTEGDLYLYAAVSHRLALGQWPYLHFPLEYPPLAALLFASPRLLGVGWIGAASPALYAGVFIVMAAALAAAASPSVAALAEQIELPPALALRRYTLILVLLFPVVMERYDVFPMLATVLAVRCLFDRRSAWAGAWLGVAIAAKLYPLVLLGVFLGYPLAQRRWRDATVLLTATLLTAILPLVPYLAIHSTAFLSFVNYHRDRGLQVESLSGAFLLLGGAAHWIHIQVVHGFGSDQVNSPWSATLLRWQPFVAITVILTLTAVAYRRMRHQTQQWGSPSPRTVIESSAALLLGFIITNKVLSPQYLVWLAPFAPLLTRNLWRAFAAIAAATITLYLGFYFRLLADAPFPVLLLNLRNAGMLAMVIALAARQLRVKRNTEITAEQARRTQSPALPLA